MHVAEIASIPYQSSTRKSTAPPPEGARGDLTPVQTPSRGESDRAGAVAFPRVPDPAFPTPPAETRRPDYDPGDRVLRVVFVVLAFVMGGLAAITPDVPPSVVFVGLALLCARIAIAFAWTRGGGS